MTHGDQPTEDTPGWDWARNRPMGPGDEPNPYSLGEVPLAPVGAARFSHADQPAEDSPAWDWNRNRPPPGSEGPNPYGMPVVPIGPATVPRMMQENPAEDSPAWDWNRNRPPPPVNSSPTNEPDNTPRSAPWGTDPDDFSENGHQPRPMSGPEDLYSEPSTEESKQEPKGTVMPVWLFLTVAVLASVVGATSVAAPATPAAAVPPSIIFEPGATGGNPPLPNLPVTPAVPCPEDASCGFIMGAIDPVFPPQTRALINIPGTCQNWAREWLRTGKDIMQFPVERIRQRFAMALMYCEFNGDNWLEGELWVSDLHECDWYTMIGVDPCGRHEQYQIIRNYGQQMRGTLPPELSMVSTLWEINLSDNLLEGDIPPEWAQMSELDTLQLSFNLFKGAIPQFVWEFEDMVYLDLAYNFFTGEIPETVHLTEPNLRNLMLENNDMSGSLPTTFGSLDWQRLHLDGNQFTGTIPADIAGPNTKEILLHNNQFSGEFPTREFASQDRSKLEEVTLYNNNFDGDVNDMCNLVLDGRLTTFAVDQDKVACDCCTGAP